MNLVDAIEKANLGQKVKRKNPSTVGFVKNDGVNVVKVSRADYEATDWVLVVPKKVQTVVGDDLTTVYKGKGITVKVAVR